MNWKAILKTVGHAALGGVVVGAAVIDPSKPITTGNVLLPIAASAATSVISLYSASPAVQPIIAIVKAILTSKTPQDPQAK